jgi:UDP-N-acetylenolpyruvoylglucosamine reductase
MNAGAWGGETWKHVVEVEVLDRRGVRHTRTPAEYQIGYRQVKGPDNEWFIGARLEFERKPGINTDAIRELLDKRRETQPIGEWSCGSVFTNRGITRRLIGRGPEGSHATPRCRKTPISSSITWGARRRSEALILHVQKRSPRRHPTAHRSAHRRRTGTSLVKAAQTPRLRQRLRQDRVMLGGDSSGARFPR